MEQKYRLWRALLTETLPYEVPVIFSNDGFFASLVGGADDPAVQKLLDRIRKDVRAGTKPYSYKIVKDRLNHTTLGIIHPLFQQRICEFYDSYAETISFLCQKGEFSLRAPGETLRVHTKSEISGEAVARDGISHSDPADGELDVSSITSYFTYRGYPLLSKFIDSPEFIRLERRFSGLRTLDVSKCFFNIYTHSITWAVKGKEKAKNDRNLPSFEGSFDQLMQNANYSETNGIVIGPEVSRIFAEIILQEVDVKVQRRLKNLVHDDNYAVRRYVDDYFIFSDNDETADEIQTAIQEELEFFKLFLNKQKISNSKRPFVSPISLARRSIRVLMRDLIARCKTLGGELTPIEFYRVRNDIRSQLLELRMIVAEFKVGFHAVSGWLLASLKSLLTSVVATSNVATDDSQLEGLTEVAIAILGVVSYVVALDIRVRPSYSLCQIMLIADNFANYSEGDFKDRIRHAISQEILLLIRSSSTHNHPDRLDNIELFNFLITLVYISGPESTEIPEVRNILTRMATDEKEITYFRYITTKFCLVQSPVKNRELLDSLNNIVLSRIDRDKSSISTNSEVFLLFCDFVSAPDVSHQDVRYLVGSVYGGSFSNDQLSSLGRHLGFVDWSGMQVFHSLKRKQLRPVYSMS